MKLKSLGGLRNTSEGATVKVLANDGLKISDKGLMLIGAHRGESRVDVAVDSESPTAETYIYVTAKNDTGKEAGGFKVAKTGQLNSKSICELLGGKGASFTIDPTPVNAGTDEEPMIVYQLVPAGKLTDEEVEAEAAETEGETEATEAAPRARRSAPESAE